MPGNAVAEALMLSGSAAAADAHFEVLGLSPDASPGEVKKTARRLFLKYHPDLNPVDREACEEKTKRIVAAYRAAMSAVSAKPAAAPEEESARAADEPAPGLDIFVFDISGLAMAVPAGCVLEVLRFKDVRIEEFGMGAGAAPYVAGVFLRGGEVTLLWNLHSQFGLREMTISSDFGNSRIVAILFDGSPVSFLVDDIRGIKTFARDALMPPAAADGTDISYIEGTINTEDGPIGLIDLRKVLYDEA